MASATPDRLAGLLGSWRGPAPVPETALVDSSPVPGGVTELVELRANGSAATRAILCRPDGEGPFPAILYAHAHGNRHHIGCRELIDGRPALDNPAYGPLLASLGFVVLCLDMPTFGTNAASENAVAKARLWNGGTLMGDMLSALSAGVSALAARPDVDAGRIGALGISMGATHAFWLAALDSRIAAVAQMCAFADLGLLVESGAHDLHGHYMTVPGMLAELDAGDIAGWVAPRPQLVCVGEDDPLTPVSAFERAFATTRAAYAAAGASDALESMVAPGSGHVETPQMRERVLDFLQRRLSLNSG